MTIPLLKNPINIRQLIDKTPNSKNFHLEKLTDIQYQMFVVVWSVAVLFHMGNDKIYTHGLHFTLLTLSVFFLLAKPSSIFRFLLFLSLHLTASFRVMPYVSNHEIFAMFVNLTIFHSLLYHVVKRKSFYINKKEFYNTFAPLIRIELIVLYFYVVFHKLNYSFLNPDFSCAVDFYKEQNSYSLLPSSKTVYILNIYFTLIIEALIPILLCIRKTRNLGLFIGLIFHLIIAYSPINGFYDISAAIFATYTLFMGPNFGVVGNDLFLKLKFYKRKYAINNFNYPKIVLFSVLITGFIFVVYQVSITIGDFFRFILWTAFSFLFIYIFLKSICYKQNLEYNKISFRWAHGSLLLFPLIILINGLCPYLGLKTETSYAMFSNLRTEGGVTNHLFVPASTQIFDYQKDIVEVVSSSEAEFQKKADHKQLLVYFQFKELIQYYKPEKVEYLRNGKPFTFTLANASNDDDLLKPHPFLLKKFLNFRTISKYEPQPCTH